MSEEEQVLKLLANKKPFEKWLKGFEPEEVVGMPGSSSSCPIAKFAQDQGIKLRVFPYGLAVFPENSRLKMILTSEYLKWVSDFVKAVDVATTSDTISSTKTLKILESITI